MTPLPQVGPCYRIPERNRERHLAERRRREGKQGGRRHPGPTDRRTSQRGQNQVRRVPRERFLVFLRGRSNFEVRSGRASSVVPPEVCRSIRTPSGAWDDVHACRTRRFPILQVQRECADTRRSLALPTVGSPATLSIIRMITILLLSSLQAVQTPNGQTVSRPRTVVVTPAIAHTEELDADDVPRARQASFEPRKANERDRRRPGTRNARAEKAH